MRSNLIESQSLSLSKLQIAPKYCIVMRSPSVSVRCDSGFGFFLLGLVHPEKWCASRRRSRCGRCTLRSHPVTIYCLAKYRISVDEKGFKQF